MTRIKTLMNPHSSQKPAHVVDHLIDTKDSGTQPKRQSRTSKLPKPETLNPKPSTTKALNPNP